MLPSVCCAEWQLMEWRYIAQRVKLQPPSTTAERNDEVRRTHVMLQQRERQQMSEAIHGMLDAMTRKLQQCAQLDITAQQRSTLLTQLDDNEHAQQQQPSSARSVDQQDVTSEKKPGEFFGVLKRSRQQAAKRVEKHARKRRPVEDKWMAKPSDQHKKQKLGTQG